MVHAGQHVLQAVAELVEQRQHLVEGHQRGLAPDRRRLIADEVGDGLADDPVGRPPRAAHAIVHPRPAPLVAGAAVGIEIEGGDRIPRAVAHPEEAHVGMPDRHLAIGARRSPRRRAASPGRTARRAPAAAGNKAAALPPSSRSATRAGARPSRARPRRRRAPLCPCSRGEGLQAREIRLRTGERRAAQALEQLVDGGDARGHLRVEGELRIAREAEQPRHLLAQGQDLLEHRRVVELARRSAGDVRAVELLAQRRGRRRARGRESGRARRG